MARVKYVTECHSNQSPLHAPGSGQLSLSDEMALQALCTLEDAELLAQVGEKLCEQARLMLSGISAGSEEGVVV